MYQIKKFYRRHKPQIILAAAIIPTALALGYRKGVRDARDFDVNIEIHPVKDEQ